MWEVSVCTRKAKKLAQLVYGPVDNCENDIYPNVVHTLMGGLVKVEKKMMNQIINFIQSNNQFISANNFS